MRIHSIGRREFLSGGLSIAGASLLGASSASCRSDRIVATPVATRSTLPLSLVVHPTGTYPDDVMNVQSAVDSVGPGGTVILKAVDSDGQPQFFHFGDAVTGRGTVSIQQDVAVCGEMTLPQSFIFPNGLTPVMGWTPDRTVIYGGWKPILCPATNPVATTLAVRSVYFAFAELAAVQVQKSAGLEVSDCFIYEVTRGPSGIPGLVVAVGIEATGFAQAAPELYGEFHVFGNVIKRREDLDYYLADTGIVLQLARMKGRIHDNRINGFALAGIGIDRNRADVHVEANQVMSCGYGPFPQSAGIGVRGIAPDDAGAPVKVRITRNAVVGGSVDGPAGSPLKSKNGMTIWGSSNVTASDNVISGTVEGVGVLLTPYAAAGQPVLAARRNEIARNDLRSLAAGRAQILLDASSDENRSVANDLGAVDLSGTGVAGILVLSNGNELTRETFWGDYPGTGGSPPIPCVWLVAGTSQNRVTALRRGAGVPAFDLCTQLRNDDPANSVPGAEACARVEP